ncbi:MAG: superoxide dismutase family protein [Pirellulaceae bacterium]|nr:superoxide dismutase family protein [Pirellulaceae bacterium]
MKKLLGMSMLVAALVMLTGVVRAVAAEAPAMKAVCVVLPTEGNKCRGTVTFEAAGEGKVKVMAKISGLNANQKHAIHVHEFGDITDLSGKSAGGHYNPEGHPHGLPPAKDRHAGDLGNLEADANGNATYTLMVDNISVAGKNPILGRAIVIHAKPDDGGQPVGNAGDRIGFGVIGVAQAAAP